MNIAVIIVSFNTKEVLKNCLRSIFKKKWTNNLRVIVVDNASSDGSAQMVGEEFPEVKLILNKTNSGFAAGNNLGIKAVKADYYLLLNSDTLVSEGSMDKLVAFASSGQFAIASCQLAFADGSFQSNAGQLPTPFPVLAWLTGFDDILKKFVKFSSYQARDRKYYQQDREVGWVSGSVMLISKEAINKIGLLDEDIFMYGEDVEYCLRAKKAGLKVGWTKQAEITHLGGGSSDSPRYNQWRGEFRGLLYIYQKYYGDVARYILKVFIYIFILVRSLAFLVLGKFNYSRTYAKILFNI